jgi:hypothetical protein
MFEQAFANVRQATESSIHLQQELFNKWIGIWSGVPVVPYGGSEKVQKVQKQWLSFVGDLVKKQRETLETQFSAGLKNIEAAFQLAEIKDPKELRTRTIEFWQKSIDCLRQMYEAQIRDCQYAAVKWTELVLKGVPEIKEGKEPREAKAATPA